MYGFNDPWNVQSELLAPIKCIRAMAIQLKIVGVGLMWKAAGGVKAGFTKMEAAFPTWASQRKSFHSFCKVPSGAMVWMDTTA